MKLSELRPILKKLKAAGWQRHSLYGGYRKRWTRWHNGWDYHIQQIIGDHEILSSTTEDIDLVMQFAEDKAKHEFKKVYGLGGL